MSRELPDTTLVPWQSSGWNNDRNIRRLLDMMVQRGEVAVAGMDGRDKLWDLAERVYPDVLPVPLAEADRIRGERLLRSLGIARPRAIASDHGLRDVGPVGEDAVVEGVRGTWCLGVVRRRRPVRGPRRAPRWTTRSTRWGAGCGCPSRASRSCSRARREPGRWPRRMT